MTEKEMIRAYCAEKGVDEDGVKYSAWSFGGAPDKLARLVSVGKKHATSSTYAAYAYDTSEPLPQIGDISVVLDSRGDAVCVIKTVKTEIVKFSEVSAEFAKAEGEGDLSLEYWRKVHTDFFTEEMRACGLEFSEDMLVLCEYFEMVYNPPRIIFETPRLILREYTENDRKGLASIISDADTMKFYPCPYDENGVSRWLDWCINNYLNFGFGLWAIELRETGQYIGDCGITIQDINGSFLPEIGYHIHKDFWNNGYASEAAQACREWGFANTPFLTFYSYMNSANIASRRVAEKNGMTLCFEYDENGVRHSVYSVSK